MRLYHIALAAFISGSVVLGAKIDYSGIHYEQYPANFMAPFVWSDIFMFAGLFVVTLFTLEVLRRLLERSRLKDGLQGQCLRDTNISDGLSGFWLYLKSKRKLFLLFVAIIVFCWLLVFFNYYPGTSMNDQLAVIGSPLSYATIHPVLYNIALSLCVRFGEALLGSGAVGMAIYVVLQMLFCASIVSICCIWLRYRSVPKVFIVGVLVYFCCAPVISNYVISTLKDTLFGYILLLWVPFLYEALAGSERFWKNRRNPILLFCLVAATALIRNNGFYIGVFLIIVLLTLFWRQIAEKKRFMLTGLIILLIACTPQLALSVLGVQSTFRESVSIPLQQVAAVVCLDEASLTNEEKDVLETILPLEDFASHYAPMSVDEIKYLPEFDTAFLQANKGDFIATYLQIGTKHPDLYMRAFLSQTYGFWDFNSYASDQSFFFAISDNRRNPSDIQAIDRWGLYNESLYPEPIATFLDNVYRKCMWYPGAGLCFLAILLCSFILQVRLRSFRWLLVSLPFIALWLTLLIATPIAVALRYAFPFVVAIPFFIVLPFAKSVRR